MQLTLLVVTAVVVMLLAIVFTLHNFECKLICSPNRYCDSPSDRSDREDISRNFHGRAVDLLSSSRSKREVSHKNSGSSTTQSNRSISNTFGNHKDDYSHWVDSSRYIAKVYIAGVSTSDIHANELKRWPSNRSNTDEFHRSYDDSNSTSHETPFEHTMLNSRGNNSEKGESKR